MSLSSKVERAVNAGFTALGDLVGKFTLIKVTLGAYDPSILKAPTTEKSYSCTGGFGDVDYSNLPNSLVGKNVESIILKSPVLPAIGDKLTHDSITFEILNVQVIRGFNKIFAYQLYVMR